MIVRYGEMAAQSIPKGAKSQYTKRYLQIGPSAKGKL
jgi:hypothetical protein